MKEYKGQWATQNIKSFVKLKGILRFQFNLFTLLFWKKGPKTFYFVTETAMTLVDPVFNYSLQLQKRLAFSVLPTLGEDNDTI